MTRAIAKLSARNRKLEIELKRIEYVKADLEAVESSQNHIINYFKSQANIFLNIEAMSANDEVTNVRQEAEHKAQNLMAKVKKHHQD